MDKSTYLEQLYKPYNPCLQNRWLTSSSSIELQKHKFHSFSPHQLKSSVVNCCTFRKNFQITFVFVVQGRYARIYYLDSISLIPNWGESRECRASVVEPNWASRLSRSNLQRCKTRGNYSTEKICEGKLKAELTMFYICQVPRVHVLLSPPVLSFAFLSTARVR